jgi:hypothetical protein
MKVAARLLAMLVVTATTACEQATDVSTASPLMPESLYIASCEEVGVSVERPNAPAQTVSWAAITRVAIRTTDEGPANPDVFWEFYSGATSPTVVFPGGATGEQECLKELQSRLKGFDDQQLIRAMGSAQNAYFIVWEAHRGDA